MVSCPHDHDPPSDASIVHSHCPVPPQGSIMSCHLDRGPPPPPSDANTIECIFMSHYCGKLLGSVFSHLAQGHFGMQKRTFWFEDDCSTPLSHSRHLKTKSRKCPSSSAADWTLNNSVPYEEKSIRPQTMQLHPHTLLPCP